MGAACGLLCYACVLLVDVEWVYSMRKFLCSVFGHATPKYYSSPAYGEVTGGNVDGIGRVHYSLVYKCDRCSRRFEAGLFHWKGTYHEK